MFSQILGGGKVAAVDSPAQKAQLLLAKARRRLQAQLQAELRVVAELGVRIERQVVGEQVDVVRQQQRQPLLHPARDTAILATPEQAVVDKNGVGLRRYGRFDQRAAGRDTGDDFVDARAPFHLQAVRPMVLEARGLQQRIEGLQQFGSGGAHALIVSAWAAHFQAAQQRPS